jgi:hypothetical protein
MSDPILCPRRVESAPHLLEMFPGPDKPRKDGTCPFCGSLTAEVFMRRVRAGDQLGPTDKSYKVYLDQPWAKFYFQHLDEAGQREFVDLLNAGRLTVGYPGRFYVLPFFIETAS